MSTPKWKADDEVPTQEDGLGPYLLHNQADMIGFWKRVSNAHTVHI